jgi:sugar phosphate isomerase/epimerase
MSSAPVPRPIALQMYTFRDLDMSFPDVLALTAKIGFAGVEPAGLHGLPATEVKRILDDLGLQVCSAHIPLPDDDGGKAALEAIGPLGAPAIFPSLQEQWFESADAVARAADRYAAAASVASAASIQLGYHNHWWEFSHRINRRHAYDVFLDELRARRVPVLLEVDIYWALVGAADPATLVESLGTAVEYLHVKDGPATPPDPHTVLMTPVGEGDVDVPAVLGANESIKWHVVELDRCGTDMVEAVRDSHRYLVDEHLSTGRSAAEGNA